MMTKMGAIRFFENLEPGELCPQACYTVESDASFEGSCSYGPYVLRMHGADRHHQRLLLGFRFRSHIHPSEIAGQFAALTSLFVGHRFDVKDAVTRAGQSIERKKKRVASEPIDPYLFTGTTNLAELPDAFEKLRALDPDAQSRFALSAYMYQQAVQVIERRPDAAFINLVTSLEAVSGSYKLPAVPTLAGVDCRLARLIANVEPQNLREEITAVVLKREKFIRRRFVAFVCDHVDYDEFLQLIYPQSFRGRCRQILRRMVGNSYDERSKALHEGWPLPSLIRAHQWGAGEGREPAMNALFTETWEQSWTFLPVAILERLVYHVLWQYLLRAAGAMREQPPGPRRA